MPGGSLISNYCAIATFSWVCCDSNAVNKQIIGITSVMATLWNHFSIIFWSLKQVFQTYLQKDFK